MCCYLNVQFQGQRAENPRAVYLTGLTYETAFSNCVSFPKIVLLSVIHYVQGGGADREVA